MSYHITLEGKTKKPNTGDKDDGQEFEKKLDYANLAELHHNEFYQANKLPPRQGAKGA